MIEFTHFVKQQSEIQLQSKKDGGSLVGPLTEDPRVSYVGLKKLLCSMSFIFLIWQIKEKAMSRATKIQLLHVTTLHVTKPFFTCEVSEIPMSPC